MSADNGIYILETRKGDGYEYRVAHLQAVENVDWDANKPNDHGTTGDYTDNDDIRIVNAREMWGECQVFTDERMALDEASRLYDEIMNDDFPILEYGICKIKIDREF